MRPFKKIEGIEDMFIAAVMAHGRAKRLARDISDELEKIATIDNDAVYESVLQMIASDTNPTYMTRGARRDLLQRLHLFQDILSNLAARVADELKEPEPCQSQQQR